jgi:myo-inositol-1(or 4)-monophosphatase
MENLKNTLIEAAKAGAERAAFYFNKKHDIINKDGVNNPVTEADKASEKAIFEVIKSNFPDHFLLSEESGEIAQDSEYKWIIDPIDGTINYAQNIPICCISIGVEKAGEMILGAVYNPFMNEFFFAEKGKGATLNGESIHVSEQTSLEKSCLATGFPYEYIQDPNGPIPVFERFISQGIALRRLGSAALDLCWTACGRYDGFYEHRLNAWDSAAGYLIVEEAGGKVTNLSGNKYNPYEHGLIASNGLIHNTLVDIISPK